MYAENYLLKALDQLLDQDVPVELLPITLQPQAGWMAGMSSEDIARLP